MQGVPREMEQLDTGSCHCARAPSPYLTLSKGETYLVICLYVINTICVVTVLHFLVKVNTHLSQGLC